MFFLLVLLFSNTFLPLCDMKYGARSSENIIRCCRKNIRSRHSRKSEESNVEFTTESLPEATFTSRFLHIKFVAP